MTLEEKYSKENNKTLIEILEDPENYTKKCLRIVKEEFLKRNIDDHFVKLTAESIIRKKMKRLLDKFDPFNDKLKPPESSYLEDDKILELLKEEFDIWLETKEAMKFDVWKYAIGGIL